MKCAKVYGVVPTYLPRVEECQHKKVANEGGTIYQDFISIIFLVFTKALEKEELKALCTNEVVIHHGFHCKNGRMKNVFSILSYDIRY